MKKTLFVISALSLMASLVVAAETRSLRSLLPSALTPGVLGQPTPIAPTTETPAPAPSTVVSETYVPVAQPAELFSDVRYHGRCNIAPCAVPTIIQVADPCSRHSCCKTYVNVEVCAPPCPPSCVKVTRDGHKVRYDFGEYAVVARTVGNHIVVRYID